jgi:DNA-binding GntR family transcriptional regulator
MSKVALWQRIKNDIRQDKLPINQLLTQQWLSEHYQVSRIPIRDAIAKLMAQGWLTTHGKKGVKIPPLNAFHAQELYLMRLPLESLALQLAFERINFGVIGAAEDILTQLDNSAQLSALEQGELNWQFHFCLYQPCERLILLNTLNQLHQQCERYLGFQFNTLDYNVRSNQEHYQLLTALRAKDLKGALMTLRCHIQEAGEILTAHLQP